MKLATLLTAALASLPSATAKFYKINNSVDIVNFTITELAATTLPDRPHTLYHFKVGSNFWQPTVCQAEVFNIGHHGLSSTNWMPCSPALRGPGRADFFLSFQWIYNHDGGAGAMLAIDAKEAWAVDIPRSLRALGLRGAHLIDSRDIDGERTYIGPTEVPIPVTEFMFYSESEGSVTVQCDAWVGRSLMESVLNIKLWGEWPSWVILLATPSHFVELVRKLRVLIKCSDGTAPVGWDRIRYRLEVMRWILSALVFLAAWAMMYTHFTSDFMDIRPPENPSFSMYADVAAYMDKFIDG